MNIPHEAIEAAAHALGAELPGRITAEISYQGGRGQEVTGDLGELLAKALEAAAPIIVANNMEGE